MSSSTSTTHLGRHLWTAVRDSVDVLANKLASRQQPLNRPILGHTTHRPSFPSPRAPPFPTARWYSHSRYSKFAPNRNNVQRSCTSGGLLLLGLTSNSASTPAVVATCAAAAETAVSATSTQKANITSLARQAWQRSQQNIYRGSGRVAGRRAKSSNTENETPKSNTPQSKPDAQKTSVDAEKDNLGKPAAPEAESIVDSVSKYLHLPPLPKMPHRPTKEELLAAANGFFSRLRVRFKWATIRSVRPWNIDEWGAFISAFVFGHIIWILAFTTTFVSLLLFAVNTVVAQETLAKWIGDYLTKSAGLTIVFESAIVPKWKDGVLTFRNVFVSRRPGSTKSSVKKGSSNQAAEAAAARKDDHDTPVEVDDGNYTQFDVTINTVNVTLSFIKWWNGKGLLKDVEIKGIRGIVDRTSVVWTPDGKNPLDYRQTHSPGDFELDHFKMEDLLVTVHQPAGFRPYSVSIFSCELPHLRKYFFFYDFLSATHMSGSFDGSLFTIHPRQIHGVTPGEEVSATDEFGQPTAWKKFSRLRIDGLKIDHLNRGVEGPFGWIYEGNVDIVADVMFPADPEEGIGKVMAEFYDKMEEAVTSNRYLKLLDQQSSQEKNWEAEFGNSEHAYMGGPEVEKCHPATTSNPLAADSEGSPDASPIASADVAPASTAEAVPSPMEDGAPSYLVMDLRIHLNDVRAAVPLFPDPQLGYINQALVRPIVAYINSRHTYIPVTCRIVKRATDFEGAWGIWDSGLMDDMAAEVYLAFAHSVEDQHSRVRRLKKVGLWSLSLVVHALLAGVAGDLV